MRRATDIMAEIVIDMDSIEDNIEAANRAALRLWNDRTQKPRREVEYELKEMCDLIVKVQKNLALLKGVLPEQ